MSKVRVLVGTRNGAFVLESDGKREKWDVSGPHFAGWELYHIKGSPVDPNRLYASQTSGWFGQIIQRSSDGGKTWETPGGEKMPKPGGMPPPASNKFVYDSSPESGKPLTTHQWYDGTQKPWEFKRVWHLERSLTDPDTVYAGVEDAALFRSKDGGKSWHELPGLRGHGTGPKWQPGAGGMCLHTIILDPSDPGRIYIAISAAAPSVPTTAAKRGSRSTRDCVRNTSRILLLRSGIAFTTSRCTHRAWACCSCRSIGMSCAAITPAIPGTRSAATCPRTSTSSSTFTPTSRRPSTLSPSRATGSTSRPRESCASIAAAPAEMRGRRSPKACRRAIVT